MFPYQNQNFNNNMNFDPITFLNFMNMMQMNQNMNQMNMNMNMNPYFLWFQMFQNNPNLMKQYNAQNQNDQSIILNGGVLPRPKNVQNNLNNDPFPNYVGPRLNILFETGAGLKINIPTPNNLSIENLLITFTNRVGVSPLLLGNKIYFIVNGLNIPIHEKSTCEQFFRNCSFGTKNQVKIIVIDASNVIGA